MERYATGEWLDARLVRTASLLSLAGTVAMLAYLFATGQGTLDAWGRPLGTDFSNVWTAGRMALEGRAAEAYDWGQHYRVQQALHGSATVPFYGWHYPPPFLLVAAALATLPYLAALAVWQATTLAFALAILLRIRPGRDTLLVAVGAPVVLVCLAHGHNGFLTAGLFGAGLLALERRPILAGICFGLLCYKPQFGLLLPLALVCGGYWRTIAAAVAAVAILLLATTLVFGTEIWPAFLASTELTRSVVLEAGDTGWEKIQSTFAAIRLWGGSVGSAYLAQGIVTAAVAAAVGWLWYVRAAFPIRAAALAIGALLGTPYVLDYDTVLLGPAIAFLVVDGERHGFRRWEATAIALAWFAPVATRQLASHLAVPLCFLSIAFLFGLTIARAGGARRPLRPAVPAALA